MEKEEKAHKMPSLSGIRDVHEISLVSRNSTLDVDHVTIGIYGRYDKILNGHSLLPMRPGIFFPSYLFSWILTSSDRSSTSMGF